MKHTKYIVAAMVASVALAGTVFAATGATTPAGTATGSTASGTTASATGTTATGASLSDALNVPGAPALVSKTANSVTLSWMKVDAAKYYVVKYSKNSVAQAFAKGDTTAAYDDETDRVTATGTTISDLKPDTTYYFSVVALDETGKNESTTNSEELAVELVSPAAAASTLKLATVNVASETALTLEFSAPLAKNPPVSVRIKKTSDSTNVPVLSVTADPTNDSRVIVALDAPLSPSSSYNVLVIDAADANGLPISKGVNAEKEFATAATLAKADIAGSATGSTASGSAPETGLNAAPEVAPVTTAAALPATGAKENLLLFLAAIIAMGIVYGVKKKRA